MTENGLLVKEMAPGITFEYLQKNTGAGLLRKQKNSHYVKKQEQ